MSFANQSRGPFEIDSVDQPPNSNYQESTSDNQQTDTADQQDEKQLSDEKFADNIYGILSDTNETNRGRVIGLSKLISFWQSFEIWQGSKDKQLFSIMKILLCEFRWQYFVFVYLIGKNLSDKIDKILAW